VRMKKHKHTCEWCGNLIDIWKVEGANHIVFDCPKCGLCWESFDWVKTFRKLDLEIFKQG